MQSHKFVFYGEITVSARINFLFLFLSLQETHYGTDSFVGVLFFVTCVLYLE